MIQSSNKTFPEENNWLDVEGFLQYREDVPTNKPKHIAQQIVVVSGGGSTALYIYDVASLAWKSVTLT